MARATKSSAARLRWPDFRASLQKRRPAGVFAFCGPELFLKREALDAMTRALVGSGAAAERERYALESHRAGESSYAEISTAASQAGLFGAERIVLVEEAERLSRVRGKERDQWIALARSAPPNPLVFSSVLSSRELAQRSVFLGDLLRAVTVVEFWHLFPRDAARWIVERAHSSGIHCTPEAAAALVEHLGSDLLLLAQEIEKLALLRPGERLGVPELRELVHHGVLGSSWECVDAVLDGRIPTAVTLLQSVAREETSFSFAWKLSRSATMRLLDSGSGGSQTGWASTRGHGGTGHALTAITPAEKKLLGRLLSQCYVWERNLKSGAWVGSHDYIGLEAMIVDHGSRWRGQRHRGGAGREP